MKKGKNAKDVLVRAKAYRSTIAADDLAGKHMYASTIEPVEIRVISLRIGLNKAEALMPEVEAASEGAKRRARDIAASLRQAEKELDGLLTRSK